jgi:hypothetical protein
MLTGRQLTRDEIDFKSMEIVEIFRIWDITLADAYQIFHAAKAKCGKMTVDEWYELKPSEKLTSAPQ